MPADTPVVLEQLANGLCCARFNRPKAANAADKDMNSQILSNLVAWEKNASARVVLLASTTDRAFCAGGDVKGFAFAIAKDPTSLLPCQSVQAEYKLISALSSSPLPSVAVMDGIAMGYGLALGASATFRIVTERTLIAMPEAAIGIFPDCGFTYRVRHVPNEAMYLSLTGARFGAKVTSPADILHLGLATHYVPSERVGALVEELKGAQLHGKEDVAKIIENFASIMPEQASLKLQSNLLQRCFGIDKQDVLEIVDELKAIRDGPDAQEAKWAKEALDGMQSASPTSLCVTFDNVKSIVTGVSFNGETLKDLGSVLKQEYRLLTRLFYMPDFCEGIRAVLVDKDKAPEWETSSLTDVNTSSIKRLFAPIEHELDST